MSWEALRLEARKFESDIDGKLVAFSKLGRDATRGGTGTHEPLLASDSNEGRFNSMALELQQLLIKLSDVNDQMQARIGDNPSASSRHILNRHGARLGDMQQEFTKTKHTIRQTLNKAELLSTAQRDIHSHRSAEARRQDLLMKEQQHTANSMRHAEDTIAIAIQAKEALERQRNAFSGITNKMGAMAKQVPMLNNLMEKIKYRKNRDKIIIAGVVAACICFLLWYLFG